MSKTTGADIRSGIRALDLGGRPLCVHASLRSFGHVRGGSGAVLDALLAEGCTVLVPAFVYEHQVKAPPGAGYQRNGTSCSGQPAALPGAV